MADERYKEGLPDYLKSYSFDPFEWNKWSSKVIKVEQKRLSMLLLSLLAVMSVFSSIHYDLVYLEYSVESWNVSKWTMGLAAIGWLVYWVMARWNLKSINSPGKYFVINLPHYCKTRIKWGPLLIASMSFAVFSLINLTYDSTSGYMVKIIMTILISFASYMITRHLMFTPYQALLTECKYKIKDAQKTSS